MVSTSSTTDPSRDMPARDVLSGSCSAVFLRVPLLPDLVSMPFEDAISVPWKVVRKNRGPGRTRNIIHAREDLGEPQRPPDRPRDEPVHLPSPPIDPLDVAYLHPGPRRLRGEHSRHRVGLSRGVPPRAG